MHYEVYIDLFFFTNFMMDSLLLLAVRSVLHYQVPVWRTFLGSLTGAVLTCLLVLFSVKGIVGTVIGLFGISTVMLGIGLKVRSLREGVKAMGVLFVSAFLLSGILQLFWAYLDVGSLFFTVAAGAYVILNGCWKLLTRIQNQQRRICEVIVFSEERSWKLQALIDTGNGLTDPVSKEPVHVIDQKTAELLGNERMLRYIPYRTVNGTGVMPAIRMEKMCVRGEREILVERPILSVCEELISENEEYQMILNADIF